MAIQETQGTGSLEQLDGKMAFFLELGNAARAAERLAGKELSGVGLTPQEAELLYWVACYEEEITPAMLSKLMQRRSHSVSGLLDRMVSHGLVYRTKDMKRANLVRVCLTEDGRDLANSLNNLVVLQKTIYDSFGSLGEREAMRRKMAWFVQDCGRAFHSFPQERL